MMTLEIQDVPPSPNVVKRKYRNPHAYRRLRTMWETQLLASVSAHHRTALKAQAKKAGVLWVQVTMFHSKAYDADNLVGAQKVLLDALVNIGFLASDAPDKLKLLPAMQVMSKRTECKTVVKIGVVD